MGLLGYGLNGIGGQGDEKYFSNEAFFGNITLCRYKHQTKPAFSEKVREIKKVKIRAEEVREINLVAGNAIKNKES